FAAAAVAAVLAFVAAARDGEARRAPEVLAQLLGPDYTGEDRLAPDFDLLDRQGRHHRLSELRGKVVALHFWTRPCEPCVDELQREIIAFDEIAQGRHDVALVLVTVDAGWAQIEPLLPPGLRTPVLFDPDRRVVAGKYGTRLFPETWVIDP